MGRKIRLHYKETEGQPVMVDWDAAREVAAHTKGGTVLTFQSDTEEEYGYTVVAEDFETVCAMGERAGDDVSDGEAQPRVSIMEFAKAMGMAFKTAKALKMDVVEVATSEHARLRNLGDLEAAATWLCVSAAIRIVRGEEGTIPDAD